MSTINPYDNSLVNSLSIERRREADKAAQAKSGNEMGQDVFLELMIAQLNNQDPLSPQDNSEFVAQLAQFSSVEGLDKLNNTVTDMAATFQSSQALQASALVGREVRVEGNMMQLGSEGVASALVELPVSTSGVQVNVYNSNGALVRSEQLGSQDAGELEYRWDGLNASGERVAAGGYRIEALASIDGKSTAMPTFVSANVNSVTVGANNVMTLNVAGIGPISMSAVKEIL